MLRTRLPAAQMALLFAFVVANSAHAASHTEITYDGRALDERVALDLDVMRDVFEDRVVPRTCWRKVQTGTHQECHVVEENRCIDRYRDVCHRDPATNETRCHRKHERICGPERHQVCTTVPDYTEVAYDCSTVERVKVGEVLDHKVHAEVVVRANAVTTSVDPAVRLTLTLAGDEVRLSLAQSNRAVLLLGEPKLVSRDDRADVKSLAYELELTAATIRDLLAPVTIDPIIDSDATSGQVQVTTGEIVQREWFEMTFALIRKKSDGEAFDKVVFNGKLNDTNATFEGAGGDRSLARVNLAALKLTEALDPTASYEASVLVRLPTEKLEQLSAINPEAVRGRRTSRTGRAPIRLR